MSNKAKRSPLLGFNHNLKYKGRVYHVQTEDSGLATPHVFTHLFHDGTILSSKKADYDQLVSSPDWEERVRQVMKEQHKDMMKELISGKHDAKILEFFGVLEIADESGDEAVPAAPALPPARQKPEAPKAPARSPAARPSRPPQPAPMRSEPQARPAVRAMPMVVISGKPPEAEAAKAPSPLLDSPADELFQPQKSRAVPESIFSDGMVTDEKSLDEVILAYLAEDLPEQ